MAVPVVGVQLRTAVNGFYENGGGKSYVYLMGVTDTEISVRENQADKNRAVRVRRL